MNINYHYFAVKVLAVSAGFSENDAQLLASYSQFVDDFDTYRYLYFKDVPEFAQYLAAKIPTGWIFNPVTTGFNSFFDYARLSTEENQKKILIPFHFITQEPINIKKEDRKEYRVKPVTMDNNSLLQSLLKNAADLYKAAAKRENLIRIGTLLHVFADTYAHQCFSGYWNWENHAYLEEVINNIDYKNITSAYSPNHYYYVPSIGHPNVSNAPDDSNISFAMQQKNNQNEKYPYKRHYSRNNTVEFLKASREILNYLRQCRGLEKVDDKAWSTLDVKIKQGLLTAEKEIDKLKIHWSSIFPEITFNYSKNDLIKNNIKVTSCEMQDNLELANKDIIMSVFNNQSNKNLNVMLEGVNNDFFYFNVIADSIRRTVNPKFTEDDDFKKYANELYLKV